MHSTLYRDRALIFVRSFVIGLIAGCAALLNTAAAKTVVPTKQGPVRGLETPLVDRFLGIPYAAPEAWFRST
jgi:hypothetical protein